MVVVCLLVQNFVVFMMLFHLCGASGQFPSLLRRVPKVRGCSVNVVRVSAGGCMNPRWKKGDFKPLICCDRKKTLEKVIMTTSLQGGNAFECGELSECGAHAFEGTRDEVCNVVLSSRLLLWEGFNTCSLSFKAFFNLMFMLDVFITSVSSSGICPSADGSFILQSRKVTQSSPQEI